MILLALFKWHSTNDISGKFVRLHVRTWYWILKSTIWSSFVQLFFSHTCLNWTCFRHVRVSYFCVFDGNIVWCWYDYCKYAIQWGPKAKGNTKYTLSRDGEFKWSSSTLRDCSNSTGVFFSNNIQIHLPCELENKNVR